VITVTNTGRANLAGGQLSISPPERVSWEGVAVGGTPACNAPLALAAGASCALQIKHTPAGTAEGSVARVLAIQYADATAESFKQTTTLNFSTKAVEAILPVIGNDGFGVAPADRSARNGDSRTFTLNLRNTESAKASVYSMVLETTADTVGDYQLTGNTCSSLPLAVNVGGGCSVTVVFTPSATGVIPGGLKIRWKASATDMERETVVRMDFTGLDKLLYRSTLDSQIDFGSVTVGGLVAMRSAIFKNVANGELNISSITVSGAGFSLDKAAPCPTVVTAGQVCKFDVRFNPATANAEYSGTLTVVSNAEGSPQTVSLKGKGTAALVPVLAWVPDTALDFGSVAAGARARLHATLANPAGSAAVRLQLANAIGGNASAFLVLPGDCPFDPGALLYGGQTCTLDVEFAPASAGLKAASIQIVANAGSPGLLALSGVGLSGPAANVGVSTSNVQFGSVKAGASSAPSDVTIQNTGSDVLHVESFAISGPFSLTLKTCAKTPFDLPPGLSCTVSVTYQPTAEGRGTGELKIVSNGADDPTMTVPLSGQGEAPPKESGGGGCSIATGETPVDPTLWLLVLAAFAVLGFRHRQEQVRRRSSAGHGSKP